MVWFKDKQIPKGTEQRGQQTHAYMGALYMTEWTIDHWGKGSTNGMSSVGYPYVNKN